MSWETNLQRWVDAGVLDTVVAQRIEKFEKESGRGRLRWPAILAIGFGTVMLCAGILLFVAAHWDQLSPGQRFSLVLGMVAVFHVGGSVLGAKFPAIGICMHTAGTVTLGAGIFLAGQIFNMQEHWPGAILLWAVGATVAWLILRQWPQALMAAVLIPCWLGGEWYVATERYWRAEHIAAQGFLLVSILYFSVPQTGSNRPLRLGLMWIGCLSVIPLGDAVVWLGNYGNWRHEPALPNRLAVLGYACAYLPVLALGVLFRRKRALWLFGAALWVAVLSIVTRQQDPNHNPWTYLWIALGAWALCFWGLRENRKLFINFGTAIFALDVIAFYFSEVLDKMGRSMGLILLGTIFLGGGWILNRLRSDLIARAAALGEGMVL
jgi:uncharacterized membrane protein